DVTCPIRPRCAERLTRKKRDQSCVSAQLICAGCVQPRVRYNRAVIQLYVGRQRGREVTSVRCWIRNCLVRTSALNVPTPFHVVEEKRPFLVRVVKLAKRNRAADIESPNIHSELRRSA